MNEIDSIKMEAISLGSGESTSVPCVFCGTKDNKLSITRTDEGIIYNCYRASCTAKGFIGSYSSWFSPSKPVFIPRHYNKATQDINICLLKVLKDRYGITKEMCDRQQLGQECYIPVITMPLFTSSGMGFGYTTKRVNDNHNLPKALHYKERDVPMLHYPRVLGSLEQLYNENIILVEDILSAIRVTELRTKWRGVALLGTSFGDDKIKALMQSGTKNIIIALDPDAVGKAHGYARDKALFFNTFRVAVMSADPKDLSTDQLLEELGI